MARGLPNHHILPLRQPVDRTHDQVPGGHGEVGELPPLQPIADSDRGLKAPLSFECADLCPLRLPTPANSLPHLPPPPPAPSHPLATQDMGAYVYRLRHPGRARRSRRREIDRAEPRASGGGGGGSEGRFRVLHDTRVGEGGPGAALVKSREVHGRELEAAPRRPASGRTTRLAAFAVGYLGRAGLPSATGPICPIAPRFAPRCVLVCELAGERPCSAWAHAHAG